MRGSFLEIPATEGHLPPCQNTATLDDGLSPPSGQGGRLVPLGLWLLAIAGSIVHGGEDALMDELAIAIDAIRSQEQELLSSPIQIEWVYLQTGHGELNSPLDNGTVDRVDTATFLIADSDRHYRERIRVVDHPRAKGALSSEITADDGIWYRSLTPEKRSGAIASSRHELLDFLDVAYPGPRGDCAGFLEAHADGGTVRKVLGRGGEELLSLEFADESNRYRVLLDPQCRYQPRQFWHSADTMMRQENLAERSDYTLEVLAFREVDGGLLLPSKVRTRLELKFPGHEKPRTVSTRVIELTALERGVEVGPETFQLPFPEGTLVTDFDSQTTQRLTASRDPSHPGISMSTRAPHVRPSLRADLQAKRGPDRPLPRLAGSGRGGDEERHAADADAGHPWQAVAPGSSYSSWRLMVWVLLLLTAGASGWGLWRAQRR